MFSQHKCHKQVHSCIVQRGREGAVPQVSEVVIEQTIEVHMAVQHRQDAVYVVGA